jgi:hypothetical protein
MLPEYVFPNAVLSGSLSGKSSPGPFVRNVSNIGFALELKILSTVIDRTGSVRLHKIRN